MSGTGFGAVLLIAVSCWPVKAQDAGLVKEGDAAFAKGDLSATAGKCVVTSKCELPSSRTTFVQPLRWR
jgi:hypothetical protein